MVHGIPNEDDIVCSKGVEMDRRILHSRSDGEPHVATETDGRERHGPRFVSRPARVRCVVVPGPTCTSVRLTLSIPRPFSPVSEPVDATTPWLALVHLFPLQGSCLAYGWEHRLAPSPSAKGESFAIAFHPRFPSDVPFHPPLARTGRGSNRKGIVPFHSFPFPTNQGTSG